MPHTHNNHLFPPPPLVIVAGPPLSGKTTIASCLARASGLRLVSLDAMRVVLFPDSHTLEDRDACYGVMHRVAGILVRARTGLIIDATYGRLPKRSELADMLDEGAVRFVLLECLARPETLVKRFCQRGPSHPAVDLTEERILSLAAAYPYSHTGLVLDTEAGDQAILCAKVRVGSGFCDSLSAWTRGRSASSPLHSFQEDPGTGGRTG